MKFIKNIFNKKSVTKPQDTGKICQACCKKNDLNVKFCQFCGYEFLVVSDIFDGFISYRRDTGSELASLLKLQLERTFNKKIFLDVNELQVGRFDEELLRRIDETPNFILILSIGSLERCVNKNDWLKREIIHALKTNRIIIPVMTEGFTFPSEQLWRLLPEDMRILPSLQSVKYSHIHQSSSLRKIASYIKSEIIQEKKVIENIVNDEEKKPIKPNVKPEIKVESEKKKQIKHESVKVNDKPFNVQKMLSKEKVSLGPISTRVEDENQSVKRTDKFHIKHVKKMPKIGKVILKGSNNKNVKNNSIKLGEIQIVNRDNQIINENRKLSIGKITLLERSK